MHFFGHGKMTWKGPRVACPTQKCSEVDQEQLLCEEISAFTKLLHEGGSRSLSIDEARRMLRAHPQDMMNLHSVSLTSISCRRKSLVGQSTVLPNRNAAMRRLLPSMIAWHVAVTSGCAALR